MLVELKNGETLNGHLLSCDTWMNLTLKEVVKTSPEGDRFMRLPEVYVKGNNVSIKSPNILYVSPFRNSNVKLSISSSNPKIKYLRVPDEIIDVVKEQQQRQQQQNQQAGRGGRGGMGGQQRGDHGGRGDRGRGRGGPGRGRGRGRG